VVIPYRRFGITYRTPERWRPIGCLETSVRNYHHALRKIPEERRFHPPCGGSLKSHVVVTLTPCVGTLIYGLTLRRRHTCVSPQKVCHGVSLPTGRHFLRFRFITALKTQECTVLTRENATGNKNYSSHAQDTITFQPGENELRSYRIFIM
jgi:hypothetical protein